MNELDRRINKLCQECLGKVRPLLWNGLRRTSINRTPISRRPSSMQRKELVARSRLKKTLLQECGDLCMTCGGTGFPFGLTLSHIIPLSRGGKTTRKNCLIECIICHDKYEKHPERRNDAR